MFILEDFKLYLGDKKLLDNIKIVWEDRWLYLILWPSWGGKTTFLKVLYVLSKISEIGQKIDLRKNKKFKKYFSKILKFEGIFQKIKDYTVWMVYQEFNLIKDLTVKDNIFFFKKEVDYDWYNYLMDYFEIWYLQEEKVNYLSWWEKARVSLVKALINRPKLLLVDETDSFLNYNLRKKLNNFLEQYSETNLVFFITHNLQIDYVKDDIVVVKKK